MLLYGFVMSIIKCLHEVISFRKGQVFAYTEGREVLWEKDGDGINWCHFFKVTEIISIYQLIWPLRDDRRG